MKQIILLAVLLSGGFIAKAQEDSSHNSFLENFDDSTSKYFKYGSTGNKADFKWTLGVNSLTEPRSKILSFKIDPSDSAGAGRRPEIISNNFTHFGTYSARLKVPRAKDIQPNVGAVVVILPTMLTVYPG